MRRLRGLGATALLLAVFLMATGQVGSCAADRSRPRPDASRLPMPKALQQRDSTLPASPAWAGGASAHVTLAPSPARLGEPIRYLAVVRASRETKVRFEPPQSGGEFTWSDVRAGRSHPAWWKQSVYEATDSVWIEARLQVFQTGIVEVPGLTVQMDPLPRAGDNWLRPASGGGALRMPTTHLVVLATVTAADSNQSLRGLHGPIGAPWWERLPLGLIVAVLALAIMAVVLVRQSRRARKPVRRRVSTAPAPSRPRLDPAAEALRALAALRAQALPASQRFGEHALELTAILRRFLEATVSTPRPGDTSGELLERLRASRLPEADLQRLEGLLGVWDRVKFAREPLTEAEARRCEESVESYVRRVAQARLEAEAAAARAAAARAAAAGHGSKGGGSPPSTSPPPPRSTAPHAPEAA